MSKYEYYQYHAKLNIPTALAGEIYANNKQLTYLDNINKINLFIGANNAGKSRIIRELLKTTERGKGYAKDILNDIKKILIEGKAQIREILMKQTIDPENFMFTHNSIKILDNKMLFDDKLNISFDGHNAVIENQLRSLSEIQNIFGNAHLSRIINNGQNEPNAYNRIQKSINEINKILVEIRNNIRELENNTWKPQRVYVPTIRTLRDIVNPGILKSHSIQKYNMGNNNIKVETGEDFYDFVLEHRNNPAEKKKRLKAFESFLAGYFFGGQQVELNFHQDDVKANKRIIHIKIGNQKEMPVYELGDGLQMIIIMTFPFFQHDCGIIAIEEPELFIHPGLQRKFLEFLVKHDNTRNFQIFIATHSNHFIDVTTKSDKISIFTVSKKAKEGDESDEKLPDFIVENVAYGNQSPLNLLGINNSSVCLANCTIWVEGVTDRLYLSKYISEFIKDPNLRDDLKEFKNYQEGLHYSFVFSGGDNIIHWDFDENNEYEELSRNIIVKNLCGKAFVIVDDDFNKNANRKKFFLDLLGDNLLVLTVPEIENLLSIDVIVETLLQYSSLSSNNADILKSKSTDEITKMKLGSFIDNIILKDIIGGKRFSPKDAVSSIGASIKSGDKVDFCEKALNQITFANMTNESKSVAEKIISFVIKQNSKSL